MLVIHNINYIYQCWRRNLSIQFLLKTYYDMRALYLIIVFYKMNIYIFCGVSYQQILEFIEYIFYDN